jgi:hypothetical protein
VNPWPFVIAAYAVTVMATSALVLWSWRAMRRSEARAQEITRR